jgi:mannose-6-phosphate isomerase-like protein (cupin superfamily)
MWETGTKDENGNVCSGDVLAEETENSLLLAEHRLVASVGIKDAVVVETSDAVLVADRRRAQDVKAIVAGLKAANRKEARSHPSRFLPWGTVTELHEEAECTVRRILLDPGQCFDMKSPMDARLCWSVVSGSGWMEENQQRQPMEQGVCTNIDPGRSIRVQADSRAPLVLMEVCITGIGFISYKTA